MGDNQSAFRTKVKKQHNTKLESESNMQSNLVCHNMTVVTQENINNDLISACTCQEAVSHVQY